MGRPHSEVRNASRRPKPELRSFYAYLRSYTQLRRGRPLESSIFMMIPASLRDDMPQALIPASLRLLVRSGSEHRSRGGIPTDDRVNSDRGSQTGNELGQDWPHIEDCQVATLSNAEFDRGPGTGCNHQRPVTCSGRIANEHRPQAVDIGKRECGGDLTVGNRDGLRAEPHAIAAALEREHRAEAYENDEEQQSRDGHHQAPQGTGVRFRRSQQGGQQKEPDKQEEAPQPTAADSPDTSAAPPARAEIGSAHV